MEEKEYFSFYCSRNIRQNQTKAAHKEWWQAAQVPSQNWTTEVTVMCAQVQTCARLCSVYLFVSHMTWWSQQRNVEWIKGCGLNIHRASTDCVPRPWALAHLALGGNSGPPHDSTVSHSCIFGWICWKWLDSDSLVVHAELGYGFISNFICTKRLLQGYLTSPKR